MSVLLVHAVIHHEPQPLLANCCDWYGEFAMALMDGDAGMTAIASNRSKHGEVYYSLDMYVSSSFSRSLLLYQLNICWPDTQTFSQLAIRHHTLFAISAGQIDYFSSFLFVCCIRSTVPRAQAVDSNFPPCPGKRQRGKRPHQGSSLVRAARAVKHRQTRTQKFSNA